MKKIKLFFAAMAAMVGLGANAQTDVTSTYLTNADFASGTPIDNNICTYGKDMASNGTTYYSAQAIDGWTNASVGETDSGYENSKLAGGLFAYGGTPWLAGSGTTAPATDPNGAAGNAAGLCAVWGGSIQYTQDVTLPAGSYTVRFKVFNSTTGSGNSSAVITKNLFGFKANAGTEYYAPNNTFAIGQWSTVAVTFNLAEETSGTISMGFVGPSGNAAMPHLFVDNIQILQNGVYEDCTSKVNSTGWTGAGDGYQGGTINTARKYGDKAIGRKLYQTVSGLENGTYEVALYSISQKEWNGSLANDAGDVAYVLAEGAYELKEWINARARATYPGDENLGIYTISGVKVTDGTMTIGMGLAKADLTEWHHVQIKSLVRTNAPDLTDFIEGYESALAAAKAVDQSLTMAVSIKAALNTAITTYDEGKVDNDNQEALEAATAALSTATANAYTSIASYAIIAAGTIPDNSLDGWTCTNANTFHINTWSSEGNSDGSNMKTPFIENWVGKGSYLGAGTVSYTLSGLEPGESYIVSALVRSYNEANSDAPNGPNFFINNVESDLTTAGTTFTFNGMSGIYATLTAEATVGNDGKITLGVRIADNRNYNWVAFKNISIRSLDAAYAAAVKEITDQEGTIPTAAYNNLYQVVTDNSTVSTASISAILAAVNTYSNLVSPYALWLATKAGAEALTSVSSNNESAKSTLSSYISTKDGEAEDATTVKALTDVTDALKEAALNYAGSADPVGEGVKFDLTFILTNHNLEGLPTWQQCDGWTSEQADGNYQVMTNDAVTSEDGTKTAFYEYWSYNAKANDKFNLYTSVTLPEGTYTMICYAFAKQQDGEAGKTPVTGVYFYANNTAGDAVTDSRLTQKTISFVNDAKQEVKIGLKAVSSGNTYNWMGIGYVELYKVPAVTVTIDENVDYNPEAVAGKVTLTRTGINATNWSTFVVPFQITNEELKTAFGEGVSVAEFSDEAYGENVQVNFTVMETPAITPNKPVLIKGTASGDNKYVFANRTIATSAAIASGTYVDFVGTYAASTDVIAGDYFISGNQLWKSTGATTIKGTRAYIDAQDAQEVKFFVDGLATSISEINGAAPAENGAIFNVAGQRVSKAQKGLYIMNGKKVIVK